MDDCQLVSANRAEGIHENAPGRRTRLLGKAIDRLSIKLYAIPRFDAFASDAG